MDGGVPFLRGLTVAVLICLGLSAGCVSIELQRPIWPVAWPWEDGPREGEINQVIAMWSDGVVVQADPSQGGKATPGFNGKVYLLDGRTGQTHGAAGRLIISLYDASGPPGQPPREVWDIDPETLKRVARKDGVGWGYALWLPWTTADTTIQKVTLMVQYKPHHGQEVWSNQSTFRVRDGVHFTPASQMTSTVERRGG